MSSRGIEGFEDEIMDTDAGDDDIDDDDDYKLVDYDEKAHPSRVVTPNLSRNNWSGPNNIETPYPSSKIEEYLEVVNKYQAHKNHGKKEPLGTI